MFIIVGGRSPYETMFGLCTARTGWLQQGSFTMIQKNLREKRILKYLLYNNSDHSGYVNKEENDIVSVENLDNEVNSKTGN